MKRFSLVVLLACLPLSGCMTEDVLNYDGVTTMAGDAIAANTVLQMVDPWPEGVEETRLRVPAQRAAAAATAEGEAP